MVILCYQPYLKQVFRRCDRDFLVVGNVDIHSSAHDLDGERSKEGHILLIISHCPCSQRQSVGYILLVAGMDPETKNKNIILWMSHLVRPDKESDSQYSRTAESSFSVGLSVLGTSRKSVDVRIIPGFYCVLAAYQDQAHEIFYRCL